MLARSFLAGYLALLVLVFIILSCSAIQTVRVNPVPRVTEFVYEGCTYISTSEGAITHKGNCPNPVHKQ